MRWALLKTAPLNDERLGRMFMAGKIFVVIDSDTDENGSPSGIWPYDGDDEACRLAAERVTALHSDFPQMNVRELAKMADYDLFDWWAIDEHGMTEHPSNSPWPELPWD